VLSFDWNIKRSSPRHSLIWRCQWHHKWYPIHFAD